MKNKIILFVLIASTAATSIIAMDYDIDTISKDTKNVKPSVTKKCKPDLKQIKEIFITIACTKVKN